MSPQDLDTLALLLERASADRDRLAGELRRAEEVQRHQQAQADHLAAYREEYVQRWSRQFGRGGAIEIVQCYQSFMQRLEEFGRQGQVLLHPRLGRRIAEIEVQPDEVLASMRSIPCRPPLGFRWQQPLQCLVQGEGLPGLSGSEAEAAEQAMPVRSVGPPGDGGQRLHAAIVARGTPLAIDASWRRA